MSSSIVEDLKLSLLADREENIQKCLLYFAKSGNPISREIGEVIVDSRDAALIRTVLDLKTKN